MSRHPLKVVLSGLGLMFVLILVQSPCAFASEKRLITPPVLMDFPFGKYYYVDLVYAMWGEDGFDMESLKAFYDLDSKYMSWGCVTKNGKFVKTSGVIDTSLLRGINNYARVSKIELKNVLIDHAFSMQSEYRKDIYIESSVFRGDAQVSFSTFYGDLRITKCKFEDAIEMSQVRFTEKAIFQFDQDTVLGHVSFDRITFPEVIMTSNVFKSGVNFWNSIFLKGLSLDGSRFAEVPYFHGTKIVRDFGLSQCTFEQGVDLRFIDWNNIKRVYLSDARYLSGSLLVYWSEIRGKIGSMAFIDTVGMRTIGLRLSESEYMKFRDNFLAQGDKESANTVMYDFKELESELFPSVKLWLYKQFMGYGYEPWRWLLFVILPLMLIGAIWIYWRQRSVMEELLRIEESGSWSSSLDAKSIIVDALKCFYLSGAIFLGIRYKRKWIVDDNRRVTMQLAFFWFLGDVSVVALILLSKTAEFEAVKGIFGI